METMMLHKIRWETGQVFQGITWEYIKNVLWRKTIALQFFIAFAVIVPISSLYYNTLNRAGVFRAIDWLTEQRLLTGEEKSNLFVAAFVSFLFLNVWAILWFSLRVYESWIFFSVLQFFFFIILLLNIEFIRKWIGSEDGVRPDLQLFARYSDQETWSPISYYMRTLAFLLYGEVKVLMSVVICYVVVSSIYEYPIRLKY